MSRKAELRHDLDYSFQIPLSGSLELLEDFLEGEIGGDVAFNSLSRDHDLAVLDEAAFMPFNSLSRDH